MTWIDFISALGGCFGLCLGFSLVSFVEIVYWGVIRCTVSILIVIIFILTTISVSRFHNHLVLSQACQKLQNGGKVSKHDKMKKKNISNKKSTVS